MSDNIQPISQVPRNMKFLLCFAVILQKYAYVTSELCPTALCNIWAEEIETMDKFNFLVLLLYYYCIIIVLI